MRTLRLASAGNLEALQAFEEWKKQPEVAAEYACLNGFVRLRREGRWDWLLRRIIRAAPTCTLWRFDWHWCGLVFRPWPRWRIPYKMIVELRY